MESASPLNLYYHRTLIFSLYLKLSRVGEKEGFWCCRLFNTNDFFKSALTSQFNQFDRELAHGPIWFNHFTVNGQLLDRTSDDSVKQGLLNQVETGWNWLKLVFYYKGY